MPKNLVGISCLLLVFGFAVGANAEEKETVLYRFKMTGGGYRPVGTPVMDKVGNLYGVTTSGGGSGDCGVIFELSPTSEGIWSYNVIYEFSEGRSCYPDSTLAIDAAGNLYGVTANGEIFELSPDGTGGWTPTIIYTATTRAEAPVSGLVIDAAGNLFGTAGYAPEKDGFVYELSPSNGGWKRRDIYDFNGTDGKEPTNVIVGGSGSLYGTTAAGGSSTNCTGGCGVVFELNEESGGQWSENVLLDFDGTNGSDAGPLSIDSVGNLYGTAATGGSSGYGLVFELTESGGVWAQSVLHDFTDKDGDGSGPVSGVIRLGEQVYGTTNMGGTSNLCTGSFGIGCGVVFKLTRSASTWNETILHSFNGGSNGAFPWGLLFDGEGVFYGVAAGGGTGQGGGVVYELSPR